MMTNLLKILLTEMLSYSNRTQKTLLQGVAGSKRGRPAVIELLLAQILGVPQAKRQKVELRPQINVMVTWIARK